MAEHYYPLKENKKPIEFLSSPDLFNSAEIAEKILSEHEELVVPNKQRFWQRLFHGGRNEEASIFKEPDHSGFHL